jgi:hypothetical protein
VGAVTSPPTLAAPPATAPLLATRLLVRVRTALVGAVAALVVAIAALAYLVSFEAISDFAVQVGAFPAGLRWCAPLLVDSFTTAATLVVLWISLSDARIGRAFDAWYAWALIAGATAASVAINVAHAPDRQAAQLVAALPPVALLLSVELLMLVARRCLADRTAPASAATAHDRAVAASEVAPLDTRTRVLLLLEHEQTSGRQLTGRQVAAELGVSTRRAQELLRELRPTLNGGGAP